ncbi:MAG: hypothetical protein H7Y13_11075 [Sphingobacteriaceae bacterium]|nr:hypothetical protein [Sphingobacteriaceae bacterium]
MYKNFEIAALDFNVKYRKFPQENAITQIQNFTNEIALALVIFGLLFIAFAKFKKEDELTAKLRLDALQWGILVNYILYYMAYISHVILIETGVYKAKGLFGPYGETDFNLYHLFTPLLIFVLRFYYLIYSRRDRFRVPKLTYLPYFPFRVVSKWGSFLCLTIPLLLQIDLNVIIEIDESLANKFWIALGICHLLLPLFLLLWAFSKNANEDEFTKQLRLESMQLAILFNYGLLLAANMFVFEGSFLGIMGLHMISPLLFFIIIFNFICNKHYWQVMREVKGGLLS